MAIDYPKVILTVAFFCLFLLFIKEVAVQYWAKKTTVLKWQEDSKSLSFPAITICTDKSLKPSGLKKFNISTSHFEFLMGNAALDDHTQFDEFHNQTAYHLGRDIGIEFGYYTNQTAGLNLHYGKNQYSDCKKNFTIEVKPWFTSTKGLCQAIYVDFKMPKMETYWLKIDFINLIAEDVPKKLVYFWTTEKDLYGLIIGVMLGNQLSKTEMEVGSVVDTEINVIEKRYFKGDGTCQDYESNDSIFNCFGRTVYNTMNQFNQDICFPYQYQDMLQTSSNICQSYGKQKVAHAAFLEKFADALENCPPPCIRTYYAVEKFNEEKHQNQNSTQIFFMFASTAITVSSEELIYNSLGLIASVGGSLGLFIGFSFLDFSFMILNFVRREVHNKTINRPNICIRGVFAFAVSPDRPLNNG